MKMSFMKVRMLISSLLCLCSLVGWAQNDDMYFVPRKAKQEKKTTQRSKEYISDESQYAEESGIVEYRDVDEYNRRKRNTQYIVHVENDTLYFEETPEEGNDVDDASTSGEWVNDFEGTEADYVYAKRLLRFRSPSMGIPVSSPLYWDLCYGPNAIYWNVYDDGIYAYAFPSYWNSFYYYDYPYYSYSCHYSHWRWRFGYTGPYFGGWYGWHPYGYYPYWGGIHHLHYPIGHFPANKYPSVRPHSSRREGVRFPTRNVQGVVKPSVGTEVNRPANNRPSGNNVRQRGVNRRIQNTTITPSGQSKSTRPSRYNKVGQNRKPSTNSSFAPSTSNRTERYRNQSGGNSSNYGGEYQNSNRSSRSGNYSTGGGMNGGSRSSGGGMRSGGGRGGRR